MLDHLNTLKFDKAQALLRETQAHLSPKARALAEEIVGSKSPHPLKGRFSNAKSTVVDELSNLVATGKRPDKTLNLWKTEKGRSVVKDALKDTVNAKELQQYLSKQSVADITKSIVGEDGHVDFKKLKELLKQPGMRQDIIAMGGQDALNILNHLEPMAKQFWDNMMFLERLQPRKATKRGKHLLSKAKEKNKAFAETPALFKQNKPNLGSVSMGQEAPKKKPKKEEGKPEDAINTAGIYGKTKLQRTKKKNASQIQESVEEFEKSKTPITGKLKEIAENMGINSKALLTMAAGAAGTIGFTAGPAGLIKAGMGVLLLKIIESPATKKAFREVCRKHPNAPLLLTALDAFDHLEDEQQKPRSPRPNVGRRNAARKNAHR